jgi:transcription elongation factor Elf1
MLPASAFNRNADGRQWWCRDCFRAYFRDRGDRHLEQVAAARQRRRAQAQRFVGKHLETHPCLDCGESDPVVLEFDHLRDKRASISALRYEASCRTLEKEILKCEVVCANCHRRRTASRADWVRADPDWRNRLGAMRPEVARNLRFAYATLEDFPCIDCGEEDLSVLDFDHIGPKRRAVMQLAMQGYGYSMLKAEVAQCEIRCANCHRRRHARVKREAA